MELNCISLGEKVKKTISETQAKIFLLAYQDGYDMQQFAKDYMRSDFCNIYMDSIYSDWHLQDPRVCFEQILTECEKVKSTNKCCSDSICYWVGYMYRQIFYNSDLSSSEIYEKNPFDKMISNAIAYEFDSYEDACLSILSNMNNMNDFPMEYEI